MGIAKEKKGRGSRDATPLLMRLKRSFLPKVLPEPPWMMSRRRQSLVKGLCYLYFMSKEDLHYAICSGVSIIMANELEKALDPSLTGAGNIYEIAKAYLGFTEKFPDYFNAIMSFESSSLDNVDPAYRDYILTNSSPLLVFVKVVEQGGKDGTIRQDIPAKELAVILWSQVNGVLQFLKYKSEFLKILGCTREDMLTDQLRILKEGIILK